jgi:plastocyanin
VTRIVAFGAAVALAAGMLAACSASAGGGDPAPSAPPGGAVILARDMAFDRGQLTIPAGVPFMLLFENRDSAPHNVTIYDDGVDGPLFVGDTFSGTASRTYEVPPIPAGTHRFRCDVHREMTGIVTAG